ncbi:hypothetical protein KP509_15G076000 [Ceratopteris richardii]|nr:hypothetical protein KP509_15G076000 [Ceratopteris richardii]
MAQESWKMETEETGCQPPEGPILCSNNCGFFGSATTMNLCSQCYRNVLSKQTKAAEAAAAISAVHSQTTALERQHKILKVEPEGSAQPSVSLATSSSSDVKPLGSSVPPSKPNRCNLCNKRVGLTGFKCRCGGLFCSLHRYNDKHNCSFDYKSAGREAISKANPIIKADKIEKI